MTDKCGLESQYCLNTVPSTPSHIFKLEMIVFFLSWGAGLSGHSYTWCASILANLVWDHINEEQKEDIQHSLVCQSKL